MNGGKKYYNLEKEICNKLPYINVGCGNRYHSTWINFDIVSNSKDVFSCDIKKGIPLPANFGNAIYSSHFIEHLNYEEGLKFLHECYRVLCPGGVLRIVCPDLENIVREYLKWLDICTQGEATSSDWNNYEWIKIELLDQMTRECTGGYMQLFLEAVDDNNSDYIENRIGPICKKYKHIKTSRSVLMKHFKFLHFPAMLFNKVLKVIFPSRLRTYFQIGKFQSTGETHKWMYDKLSLTIALEEIGFRKITLQNAFTSNIPDWGFYNLDLYDGQIYAPSSIFIEAIK